MDEALLPFNRTKHACYTQTAKRVLLAHLAQRCEPEHEAAMWEKIQLQYTAYLEDMPPLGGEKNMRAAEGGIYDCIAIMAFYTALPEDKRPDAQELYEMNGEMFLPSFAKLAGFINVNGPLHLRLLDAAFQLSAKRTNRQHARCPADYVMICEPYNAQLGPRYRFEQCPIADFARAHGLLHLMPPLCNVDYVAMELLHGTLLRRYTCANGSLCDYRVVGSEHPDAKKYPRKTDAAGFWYNEV